jgi:hypothetical protein
MFLIDIIVPFTVPFGLYIVRRRPNWFKNTAARLYADQPHGMGIGQNAVAENSNPEDEISDFLDRRYQQLERSNFDFAESIQKKHG